MKNSIDWIEPGVGRLERAPLNRKSPITLSAAAQGHGFERTPTGLGYRRVLAPLGLSASSQAGLALARSMAKEMNAQLLLLHAIDLNIAGEERGIPRTRLLNQRRRDAEIELGRIAHTLGDDLDCEFLVETGKPSEVILQTARRRCADAIVMGTHGLRGWMKWLHRNTAEAVARSAPCAVWLISPGKSEDALNLMVVEAAAAAGAS